MRVTVVVHERDVASVRDWVFESDDRLIPSQRLFPVESHTFEVVIYKPRDGGSSLVDPGGAQQSVREVAERTSTWILIAGDHALTSRDLTEQMRVFLGGLNTPSWSNEALVVLHFSEHPRTILDSLPPARVFHIPEHSDEAAQDALPLPTSIDSHDVKSILDAIEENQTQNPNIGFGLLLMNHDGEFFLMERLRQPGNHKLGTIGGNFHRGKSVTTQLDEILSKRFRKGAAPRIELGPLLACTSMRNSFYHYVDLTFLATTARRVALSGVSDPELQPVSRATLSRLRQVSKKEHDDYPRYTFNIEEMAWLHSQRLLFQPVANAFEALCRRGFAYQAKNGQQDTLRMPPLFSGDGPLDIPWSLRDRSMRTVLDTMSSWSNTALPFFEGPL